MLIGSHHFCIRAMAIMARAVCSMFDGAMCYLLHDPHIPKKTFVAQTSPQKVGHIPFLLYQFPDNLNFNVSGRPKNANQFWGTLI